MARTEHTSPEVVIACDLGKYQIKAVRQGEKNNIRSSYRSKIYKMEDNEHYDPQGNSKFITYNGDSYLFGDQGLVKDNSLDKGTILHKVGLMSVLSDLAKEGDRVNLVLGVPALIYRDRTQREKFRDYITNNGKLEFKTLDNDYKIILSDVFLMPESAGAVYTAPDHFINKSTAVIDIGGLNLNFSVYNNLTLDVDSLSTVNYGAFALQNEIRKVFGSYYNTVITDQILENIISNRNLKLNGKTADRSEELFDETVKHFVRKIPSLTRDLGYDISQYDEVVFIGGTSQILTDDVVKQVIPHASILKDSQWSNVDGFLKAGSLKYAQ